MCNMYVLLGCMLCAVYSVMCAELVCLSGLACLLWCMSALLYMDMATGGMWIMM